jgi:thiamine kinase-like enzyme
MPLTPFESPFVGGFARMHKVLTESVRSYGDCDVYADKIAKWDHKKLMTQWIATTRPMKCGFEVMNHGDAWMNNMMFKQDEENNTVDVKMVDFQGPFWASPAYDILYFMISSVADDIKVSYFDDIIEFYHDQLKDSLKKLDFDQYIPTLSEFHDDLLDKGAIGKL